MPKLEKSVQVPDSRSSTIVIRLIQLLIVSVVVSFVTIMACNSEKRQTARFAERAERYRKENRALKDENARLLYDFAELTSDEPVTTFGVMNTKTYTDNDLVNCDYFLQNWTPPTPAKEYATCPDSAYHFVSPKDEVFRDGFFRSPENEAVRNAFFRACLSKIAARDLDLLAP